MDAFWKWLMHLNARRVCVFSTLIFIGVIGWRAWIELPDREKNETRINKFTPSDYTSIPILAFVAKQLDPANAVVPICPFRPPAEAMPTNQIVTGDVLVTVHNDPQGRNTREPKPGALVTAEAPDQELTEQKTPDSKPTNEFGWGKEETRAALLRVRPSRPINVYYRGRMQRPDGTTVAYMSDSQRKGSCFVGVGAQLFGATILAVDKQKLLLELPDGQRQALTLDEYVTITPEAKQ